MPVPAFYVKFTLKARQSWIFLKNLRRYIAVLHESQNHRMVGIRRDLWGSSSPTPLLKMVHLYQVHRTSSRQVLNISREG